MKNQQKVLSVIFLTVFVTLALVRCSLEKQSTSMVAPPLKNVDVAYLQFDVNGSQADTIKIKTGSSIIIPKDAFVDETGKPYVGEVKVKYREFYNSTDILASGISMEYDSAGQKLDFQTAGMFEILASDKENKALSLANGKEIVVNMASYVDGSLYNFYSLDKKNGWKYEGRNEVRVNSEKKKLIALIPDSIRQPVKPKEMSDKEKSFNLSFDENEHPELKGFADVVWQYSGLKGDSVMDPSLNSWVYTYNWQKADLGKYNSNSLDFELLLSSPKRKFKTTVSPVLKGKRLEKAMKEFNEKLSSYKKIKEQIKNAEELAATQGDFVRSFSVKQFGIYNWDCVLSQPDRMAIKANFKFDGDIDVPEKSLVAYLITGSDRSLVKYSFEDWDKFSFSPKATNKIVVLLPGNKIAIFDEKQFKQLDLDKIKHDNACTFQLHLGKSTIQSMADLSEAISG